MNVSQNWWLFKYPSVAGVPGPRYSVCTFYFPANWQHEEARVKRAAGLCSNIYRLIDFSSSCLNGFESFVVNENANMLKMFPMDNEDVSSKRFSASNSWCFQLVSSPCRCDAVNRYSRYLGPFIKTTLHLHGVQKALGDITVATPTSVQLIGRSTGVVSLFLFLVSSSTWTNPPPQPVEEPLSVHKCRLVLR